MCVFPYLQETQRLLAEPVPGIKAEPDEANARYFHVVIAGPQDSPFEGGTFKLELFLPEEYPMAAPKVRFMTKIYHPNVDKLGRICLDILKGEDKGIMGASELPLVVWRAPLRKARGGDFVALVIMELTMCFYRALPLVFHPLSARLLSLADKWSPALQIRTVLLSIQALLSAPNPDDPLANDVAEQWKTNEAQAIETGELNEGHVSQRGTRFQGVGSLCRPGPVCGVRHRLRLC